MAWAVEYTDEFGEWWQTLTVSEQEDIAAHVEELERRGPHLPFPYSSGIAQSRHGHMRELRVQSGSKPLRIFYAFDSRRAAILLIGGDKTGDNRFYKKFVPLADELYQEHLTEIKEHKSNVGPASILETESANVSGVTRARRKKN